MTPPWPRLRRLFVSRAANRAADGADRPPATNRSRALPQFSDYALQEVVARNDRSTVYRATHRASGQLVAMKTMQVGQAGGSDHGAWRARFLREASAAAALRHENIVRVHAGGVQGEGDAATGWLAMEWVAGADLSRYATPARRLPEAMVLAVATRVALALDFAHAAGIVHRDVKPSNVLFNPVTGDVKLTDFGSARVAGTTRTRTGVLIGTPAYMSPEQLDGGPPSVQGDLYALGVTLYELLAGQRPFESDSMGELLNQIARDSPAPLSVLRPELPPLIDDIMARLLSKAPERRHASGRELSHELRLVQHRCAAADPRNVAAAWVNAQAVQADTPNAAPVKSSFQGTIVA